MAELIDVFLTKKDNSQNSSYKDEIIVKIKDEGEMKYFASTIVGFIKVKPYDMRGGYNKNLFENIKEVSLIKDIPQSLPIYLVNPLFSINKTMAVVIHAKSGEHVVCLKTKNGTDLFGAYALDLDKERVNHLHKQAKEIKSSDLVDSIVRNLENSVPGLKINKQKENVNE